MLITQIGNNSYAQQDLSEIHCKHFFNGCPLGTPPSNDLIIRDIYALSSNDNTKFADWVAYRLTPDMLEGTTKTRNWKADPWLEDKETLEPNDYNDIGQSGYDRGHQAPLADFKGCSGWEETNFLSNITPQNKDLNQGAWLKLEDFERNLTKKYGLIYVITGPYYNQESNKIETIIEPHKLPAGYWKIIAIPQKNKYFIALSFIFGQTTKRNDIYTNHVTTINNIEKITGLNFFSELEDKLEENLENTKSFDWIMNYIKK